MKTVDYVRDYHQLNLERISRPKQGWQLNHIKLAARNWFLLACCGAVIGAIGVVLTISTSFLADLKEGHCSSSWYLNKSTCCSGELNCIEWIEHGEGVAFGLYVFVGVLFALCASYLVMESAPLAAGSGISEIKCIVSGFAYPQFLTFLVLVVKCIALPLTIASGVSVGKEGPSVHYAACVGEVVSTRFTNIDFRKRGDLLTACCAAGVAVAFGSPIGGLLFGIEEIAFDLSLHTIWRSFFCCLVATSVVSLFNPFRNGQLVLFSVQYDSSWHMFELPFFVLIGVFGGVVGHFIIKLNLRISALRKKYFGQFNLIEAVVLSLLTGVLCYFNEYLMVDMTKSMQMLFRECEHGGEQLGLCNENDKFGIMFTLIWAFVIRLLLLLVSYGAAKLPAGIFVPSLAIGALFGRLVGTLVWHLYTNYSDSVYFGNVCTTAKCINPGAYAVLGAGALLAGVMHITLTVVVVMFEVTGAVHYIVPTMIVVCVTRLVSRQLGSTKGIADRAIEVNMYPFMEQEPPNFHNQLIRDVMVPASQCATLSGTLFEQTQEWTYATYPVVDNGDLVGAYDGSVLNKSPITFSPDTPLETVYTVFGKLRPHTVYVVDEGKFVGLLTRKGVINAHKVDKITFSEREELIGKKIAELCAKITSIIKRR